VPDGSETLKGPLRNALGGRIRRYQPRAGFLQGFKLGEELVILPVTYLWLVQDVVEVIVLSYFSTEALNSFFNIIRHNKPNLYALSGQLARTTFATNKPTLMAARITLLLRLPSS
jgi:hypothetical protein